ncbi:MAG: ABC transporter permease [Clostridia bacterium]|nr:ABC transporter permease [Clostridia bacterium]
MAKYIVKRILYMLLVVLILSFLIYLIFDLVPFDRAKWLVEKQKDVYKDNPEGYQRAYLEFRRRLGLDENVFVRYLGWLGLARINGSYNGILQGNFGYSYNFSRAATEVLSEPMKNTVFINLFAVVLALAITIPLGIFCAVKRGTRRDTAVQVFTIVGYSMPTFITAILFICFFAVIIPIFPVIGMKTPGSNYTGIRKFFDQLYYMALPLIVMTFCSLGGMTRYVRSSMIEALSMDCIRTARAKGLKENTVVYSHAWRNALVPVITLVIGWFLSVFSGSIMIENIFALNGVGIKYIEALQTNDYEVALLLQMFYVAVSLLGNLIIDISYGIADPRVRVAK